MSKPVLTVVLGRADLVVQRGHLDRGALFLPLPEPLPEPFAEIVLHVERAGGGAVELEGRVLQILAGRGIAVSFDDVPAAKAALAQLFDAGGGEDAPTLFFWGRSELPPVNTRTDPAPPPVPSDPKIELNETATTEAQIAAMSANQKLQLAMKGDRVARTLLLKEPNKAIQAFLLQNPRITLEEVRHLAGFRQASPDALNAIAANRDWSANPTIASALVRNPKTPGATAARMIEKLPMDEVRRLAKANDVPPAVVIAARKKVANGK